jgi:hypothetical protein
MDGGATGGYCAIGNCVMDTAPITMMNSAMTQAKMGRSMKKLAMARTSSAAGRRCRGGLGRGRPAQRWPQAWAWHHPAAKAPGLPVRHTIIFWKPSTMTLSPGCQSTRITTTGRFANPPASRGGGLVALAHQQHAVTLRTARHGLLGHQHGVAGSSACDKRTRTYWPGSTRPSGLGTSARSVTWPVLRPPSGH